MLKEYQVTILNSKKIDKNNKKLLELRIRSVKEQSKQQKPDGDNKENDAAIHTVKGTVSLLESSRFPQFYFVHTLLTVRVS